MNNHIEADSGKQSITITHQPAHALPAVTFFDLLVDSQHAPVMPEVFDKVDLVVQ